MIIEYGKKAIERAEYKKLVDGSWFTEIPGFQGVWANGDSVEQCRNELVTVLEEWLLLGDAGNQRYFFSHRISSNNDLFPSLFF